MPYKNIAPPAGEKITRTERLDVPDRPIIPFIRGDGTGPDIWAASVRVFDAAVEKAYGGKKKVAWFEVFAGQAAKDKFDSWLPDDTVEAFREYLVGIKGPLTTPVGGGIRSLNVALRQLLDLYVCLRPVRWFRGVPSPVKHPEKVDAVIFRENTEDIYAGIEFAGGSPEAQKVLDFFAKEFPKEFKKVRFGSVEATRQWQTQLEAIGAPKRDMSVEVGVGVKPISYLGTERLVHSALGYAVKHGRKSLTLVHKGNIMKFTEGAFRDWGYTIAKDFYGAAEIDGGPWCRIPEGRPGAGLVIKDAIADVMLQQVLTRPDEFDVIATPNLNGDYLSDALAAQVGGIGIGPRWQHQLHDRPRHLRGDARHGAQVRQPGQGEPGLGHPLRRDDVPSPRLGRSGRCDRARHGGRHRGQDRHLRLPPPHGGRHAGEVLRVRAGDHRAHVVQ